MSNVRVMIKEEDVEGPLSSLNKNQKDMLLGKEEDAYESNVRCAERFYSSETDVQVCDFVEKLAKLFPHEGLRKSFTVNCRFLLDMTFSKGQMVYHFYILLYKKYLMHFVHENMSAYDLNDMIRTIHSFKEEYKAKEPFCCSDPLFPVEMPIAS